MKKSHRKGLTMEQEYGRDKMLEIKKKFSDAAISRCKKEQEYICSGCKNVFISPTTIISKNKYCTKNCQILNTNLKLVNCANCELEILKRTYTNRLTYFCNRHCYNSWQKSNNIRPPDNELRRKNANSVAAIDKRRKTCIDSGIWHDPTVYVSGMDKKQYTKLVRILTKLKRAELIKIWDGYDYYTKEYIRDNFQLHWSHGDYPSIDHKISITEGMKLGMTPVQLCDLSNLVYTKKRINSMKRSLSETKFWQKIKTLNV